MKEVTLRTKVEKDILQETVPGSHTKIGMEDSLVKPYSLKSVETDRYICSRQTRDDDTRDEQNGKFS